MAEVDCSPRIPHAETYSKADVLLPRSTDGKRREGDGVSDALVIVPGMMETSCHASSDVFTLVER